MFLNDLAIKRRSLQATLITPFKDYGNNSTEKPSFGLSCCGYDLTLGSEFKILYSSELKYIDPSLPPHEKSYFSYNVKQGDSFFIKPNQFVLAHTVEHITMPSDLIGFVMDKSSLARLGLMLFNTVIEPGWAGQITLEIVNNNSYPIKLTPNMGICQIMFSEIEKPLKDYPTKSGKYQDQRGATVSFR
jgi:dCTP deaminase